MHIQICTLTSCRQKTPKYLSPTQNPLNVRFVYPTFSSDICSWMSLRNLTRNSPSCISQCRHMRRVSAYSWVSASIGTLLHVHHLPSPFSIQQFKLPFKQVSLILGRWAAMANTTVPARCGWPASLGSPAGHALDHMPSPSCLGSRGDILSSAWSSLSA